jgi:hypothetical protein
LLFFKDIIKSPGTYASSPYAVYAKSSPVAGI